MGTTHTTYGALDVPAGYTVYTVRTPSGDRYYPMLFGEPRTDARGYPVSFGRLEDAAAFCRNEGDGAVRALPAAVEVRVTEIPAGE